MYSVNVSFHGVSRVKVSKIDQHCIVGGRQWLALTLHLYDAAGNSVDAIGVHADPGMPLAVEVEGEEAA